MPGLHIYTSNRMEILAEQLARVIRTPLSEPLATETVVVQSRGMERWISMRLAEFNGISANTSYPFPNAFLENIFKTIKPDLPDLSPFDPSVIAFRLMRIIPRCLKRKEFEILKSYLVEDDNQLKLYQLSTRIADLFDQYLVFRPELISGWEENKASSKNRHEWQAELWRELVSETDCWHRARLRRELFARIDRLELNPRQLPERVSIFGISYLPLFHLQTFARLSGLIEINFFLIDPCKEYWADIVSEQELKKIRRKHPGVAENIDWYHFEKGNRLLASMGTLGRNFFDSITEFDCEISEHFESPETDDILACIQSDILNLRDIAPAAAGDIDVGAVSRRPSDDAGEGHAAISAGDTSLQIHSCHSPMREIEVLHDNLLAMFEEDPELLPKDIIVMTPDIETYAPYVHAVFDAQTDKTLRIPFSIADRSPRRENRMVEGFLALLNIADSRFGAVEVVRLLEYSGIKERFEIGDSDLKIIERWVNDTHIRWGIDKTSREENGLPGYSENTWRSGLERLILGYALPGENRMMFQDILPYDHIEGGEVQILGRFLEFVDRLFGFGKNLKETRRLSSWRRTLFKLIDQFLKPDETTERELQLLRQVLDSLADKEFYADFNTPVDPAVVRAYLKSTLEQNRYGSGFLTGGVTFCAMLPMRSIPFKVICLIGMNNDAFPRDHQPFNFDLIAKYPRTGDRSRRHDDKYLFLESIISARQKFYISYVGQSIQDNSPIPPSVLVSELLDSVENRFKSESPDIMERILTEHRLQQFSPWYFTEGSRLFSYSTENMLAAAAAFQKSEPEPFFNTRLPMTPDEAEKWRTLDLDTLCNFFLHPAKFLIQRRVGIQLGEAVALTEDRESFTLEPLDRYQVGQDLVDNLLAGCTVEDIKPILKAIGNLPHGNIGDYHYNEMSIEAQGFIRQTEKYINARRCAPIDVDLEINGFRLSGRLPPVSEYGYTHIRYARKRVKDLLKTWIYHLLYCLTASAEDEKISYLICKDSTTQFAPVIDPIPILTTLTRKFRLGLQEPIHFFPETSFEYAERLLKKSASDSTAIHNAERKWLGNDFLKYGRGESRDPYYDLCFRHLDPIDETFRKTALEIFEPLLAHIQDIKI
jgi:exodeoxyribonuclease V gamma subunit